MDSFLPDEGSFRRLVVGAFGYVGQEIIHASNRAGIDTIGAVRATPHSGDGSCVPLASAADLDALLESHQFDQIVTLIQLDRADADWILDRIDGERWLVFSSAQLGSDIDAPGSSIARVRERLAVKRGAVVVRPTMIYGRGRDRNITRTIHQLVQMRVPIQIGDGAQLVQPVHVDDVVAFVDAHLQTVCSRTRGGDQHERPLCGVFPIGGPEAIPARELMQMMSELLGLRSPILTVKPSWLNVAAKAAPLVGLRRDQVMRLVQDKTVDDATTRARFGWEPAVLSHRLEQAVGEATGALVS